MNGPILLLIGSVALPFFVYEALRKRADWRADAYLRHESVHCDDPYCDALNDVLDLRRSMDSRAVTHGQDPYAAPQQDACGECPDISTSGGGDA